MGFIKRHKVGFIIICLLCVVVIGVIASGVFSKYKETIVLDNVSLTVTGGNLADEFTLKEHKATQNADGTYSLGSEVVTQNAYRTLPGITIPKDPYVTIQGKTKVDSYLYVEVVDGTSASGITYSLTDDWKALGFKGIKGGDVYIYTAGGSDAALLDEKFPSQSIQILKDNQVSVSKSCKVSYDVTLTFYGYLGQASLANTAKEVYNACFGGGK